MSGAPCIWSSPGQWNPKEKSGQGPGPSQAQGSVTASQRPALTLNTLSLLSKAMILGMGRTQPPNASAGDTSEPPRKVGPMAPVISSSTHPTLRR